MLEYHENADNNVVEFVVDGKISKEEFENVISRLEAAIKKHGKINLLEQVLNFGTFPISKLWEDIKFGLSHLNDFERVAVVGDQRWLETWTKALRPLLPCDVQFYNNAEIEQARQWLLDGENH